MIKVAFLLVCGFILGALVMENKQYFFNTVTNPVAFLPDGGEYDGELLKGELHSKGRIVWPNGDNYDGGFKYGLFHGYGRYETAERIYQGDFIEGVARGKGRIIFADGRVYEGDIVDAKADGQGLMQLNDGEYIGGFKDDLFHGEGKLVSRQGDVYEGFFNDGEFQGQGLFTAASGDIYRGEFVKGAFTGKGDYRNDEASYTGEFKNWLFDGVGKYKGPSITYSGEFLQGQFHGMGAYESDAAVYQGRFKDGLYHGKGVLEQNDERYDGHFEYGMKHGEGTLTYAKPLDGLLQIKGRWRYDELVSSDHPLAEHDVRLVNEDVLYNQNKRLQNSLSTVHKNDPTLKELYFVGIAGDGSQGVFRREVNYIRELFDRHYATMSKSALLINGNVSYRDVPLATTTSIRSLLQGVAEKMDPDNDVLFIYFTSHGSKDFQFQLEQPGMRLKSLDAETMGDIIKSLPVKHKVVVISACYAGGYVNAVKDDNTMVIVAASADKTSFGCSDTAEMTYFGEAFFKDALWQSSSFEDAFDRARDIVRGREAKEGYEFSNPRIFKPKAILAHLKEWRSDFLEWRRQQNRIITSTQ